ncbi:type IV toxin-antitoxin system AbiEi family antitoxin domain-containing protein [Candidatus Weimeria sp. HCP3S3_B5]|uniref:type IV toxin-antitoxin system AbiEi family antitoxin domain-containing protein n=1 Tax=Candidatus Weimeria sp. HCP3S3_B5 TaxID=3438871 RepID=UPI003F8AC284
MSEEIPMYREEKRTYDLERIEALIEENGGLARTSQITGELGVDYRRLQQFVAEGSLTKIRNGAYTYSKDRISEERLIYALFHQDGVLTMESALYYHGYLKQRPYGWSIAIDKNASKSRFKLCYPIVKPYYTKENVLKTGVMTLDRKDFPMKIYDKDRLICDVLKYQEKMDRKEFREGVFSYIRDEDKNVVNLMKYAKERQVIAKVRNMIGVWL